MVWSNQAPTSITIPPGATSGARIVIDNDGIHAYDANNVNFFNLSTSAIAIATDNGSFTVYSGTPAYGNIVAALAPSTMRDQYDNYLESGLTLYNNPSTSSPIESGLFFLDEGGSFTQTAVVFYNEVASPLIGQLIIYGPASPVGGAVENPASIIISCDASGSTEINLNAGKTLFLGASDVELSGNVNSANGITINSGGLTVTGGITETEFRSGRATRSGTTDNFSAGSMVILGSVDLPANAPAGTYLITCNCAISSTAACNYYFRILAAGTNITADDVISIPANTRTPRDWADVYEHTGGAASIAQYVEVSAGTGAVYNTSYHLSVTYIGS